MPFSGNSDSNPPLHSHKVMLVEHDPCESGLFTYLVDNLHVNAGYHNHGEMAI